MNTKSKTHSRIDKYELLETIGQGYFSKVKLAKDIETDQLVAIKIHNADAFSERKKETLINEIMHLEQLDHPSIVKLIEWKESAI